MVLDSIKYLGGLPSNRALSGWSICDCISE